MWGIKSDRKSSKIMLKERNKKNVWIIKSRMASHYSVYTFFWKKKGKRFTQRLNIQYR